jgi:nanoRNase/pAp phosphatase (c-di-AMP/oligoRNAs hydrolase)
MQALIKKWVSSSEVIHITETHRYDNRAMIRLLTLDYKPFRHSDLSNYTKFVMLDGQPQYHELTRNMYFDVIIDHHPNMLEHRVPFTDIRPNYGATSTILIDYLISTRVRITPRLATAFYYAIKTDTDSFRRVGTQRDVTSISYLLPKMQIETVRLIESSEIQRRDLKYMINALQNICFHKNLAYVHLGEIDRDELCTTLADFLLRIRGVHWSMVSAIIHKCLVVIMRSWKERKHVGKITARAFGPYGKAGGHQWAARAELPIRDLPPDYLPLTDAAVASFIDERVFSHHKKPGNHEGKQNKDEDDAREIVDS